MPDVIDVDLYWDGVYQGTTVYYPGEANPDAPWQADAEPGDTLTLAAQVALPTTTGEHNWTMVVSFPDSDLDTLTTSGYTFTISQDASVFGAGWGFTGVDRLYAVSDDYGDPVGILRAFGDGTWDFYFANGFGGFISPAGDYGTLAAAAGGYLYTQPDGEQWIYNSDGLETAWISADGNQSITATYDDDGNILTYTAIDGTTSTFNYSDGCVTSITTPGLDGPVEAGSNH